jgi:hypothetical protein
MNYHRLGLTIATIGMIGGIVFGALMFKDNKWRLEHNAVQKGALRISVNTELGIRQGPAPEELCKNSGSDYYYNCVRHNFSNELKQYYLEEYAKFFGVFGAVVALCGILGYVTGCFLPRLLFASATNGRAGFGAWLKWVRAPEPTKQDP